MAVLQFRRHSGVDGDETGISQRKIQLSLSWYKTGQDLYGHEAESEQQRSLFCFRPADFSSSVTSGFSRKHKFKEMIGHLHAQCAVGGVLE